MKRSPDKYKDLDENIMALRGESSRRLTLDRITDRIEEYENKNKKFLFIKYGFSIAMFLGILFLVFQLTSLTDFNQKGTIQETLIPPTTSSDGGISPSENTESDSEEEPVTEEVEEQIEEDPLEKYGDFYIVEEDYIAINTYAVMLIDEEADEILIENVNIKDFARDHVNVFKEIPDHESERLINAGFPEEYYYYLSATGVQESIGPRGYIQVTGEEIEKVIAEIMEVTSVMVAEGKPGYPMGEEMEELVQQMYELFVELDEYVNGRDS
ncbi:MULTISPECIES: hypothetical protein [Bacillaceae]|uniref:Uncharacterized protein n=1 Tax=Evansella alkalicola TaxID=745819 RepID=A0ABS6JNV6_9BACI|nr:MULTISPECIES: hypothetical protein [Bacillaceae]MBU9720168.1 hypothetical protein [Bacillus alkalicola]